MSEKTSLSDQDHNMLIKLHENVKTLTKSVKAISEDHEKRLRKQEADNQKIKGALAVLVFIAGILEPVYMIFKGTHK